MRHPSQTWGQSNSRIGIAHQFQNCLFKKKELELINLELSLLQKKTTPTPSMPVLRSKMMDDFNLATMLDPCFKLDWSQNNESYDAHNLLTSQVVQLSPTTPAEYMELNLESLYLELINLMWNWLNGIMWNWKNGIDPMSDPSKPRKQRYKAADYCTYAGAEYER